MSERLFIRLPADARDAVRWGLLAPGAEDFADTGSVDADEFARLGELGEGRAVVVVVPGTDVLFTSANLPTKQARQMQKALPFMLEEQLVGDVDEQHFALGERQADGTVPVAVVDKDRMADWMSLMSEAGLKPEAMVPDVALMPGEASVLMDGSLGLLKLDALTMFALESEMLPDVLALRLAGREGPALSLAVHGATEKQADALEEAVAGAAEPELFPCGDPLMFLASHYHHGVLNLLQGSYAPKKDTSGLWLKWRPVAMLALGVLLMQFVVLGIESWRIKQERDALKAQIDGTFAEAFPGEKLPGGRDPKKALQAKVDALLSGGGAGFLNLMQQVGNTIAQTGTVRPTAIAFDGKKGELRMDVIAPDFDTLERFRQALSSQGLSVESGPASGTDGGYQGRLVIRSQP